MATLGSNSGSKLDAIENSVGLAGSGVPLAKYSRAGARCSVSGIFKVQPTTNLPQKSMPAAGWWSGLGLLATRKSGPIHEPEASEMRARMSKLRKAAWSVHAAAARPFQALALADSNWSWAVLVLT